VRPFLDRLSRRLNADERHDEAQARALVRDLVLGLQAALLLKHAPSAVSDAFCASRLVGESGGAFGTLPHGADLRAIVERATPLN
jgi:putative acyl-CoA dehydrogenase